MARDPGLTSHDYAAALRLVGELGELQRAGRTAEARAHFGFATTRLLRSPALWWCTIQPVSGAMEVIHSEIVGLDEWQLREWNNPFVLERGYAKHPMWSAVDRMPGQLRTFSRAQVVSDTSWNDSPHVELPRRLGFDDALASSVPLAAGRECLVTVSRQVGDRRYGQRECLLLHALQGALGWFHREVLDPPQLARELAESRLAPRYRPVLRLLRTGLSEKEIAARLGLSPRTVHKYVEVVFDAFEVNSRPELMARWIDP